MPNTRVLTKRISIMPTSPLPLPQRMTYRIGRGETLVLTFEPYKSEILPLWRFRTPLIARQSSTAIFAKFLEYDAANDFVGMDMCRKFLQMGMTRAKRYANHKGGRKYDKQTGEELEKSKGHDGREEKEEASLIFREVWGKAKEHEGYQRKKEVFQKEQREWDKEQRKSRMEGDMEEMEEKPKRGGRAKVKKEIKEEEDGNYVTEGGLGRGNRLKVKRDIKEEEVDD